MLVGFEIHDTNIKHNYEKTKKNAKKSLNNVKFSHFNDFK